MKLFLIHCGFYDDEISGGIYEFHVNIPVAALTKEEAKLKVRALEVFTRKKMHIDGIQQINIVDGHAVHLEAVGGKTDVESIPYRDL